MTMRKTLTALAALLPALCARGGVPADAAGWYTPPAGSWNKNYVMGGDIAMQAYDAKAASWQDVTVAVSTDSHGNRYISTEAIEAAFAGISASIKTALYATGVALDGLITLDSAIAWNKAAIETLGANLAAVFAEMDAESQDDAGNVDKGTAKINSSGEKAVLNVFGITPVADEKSIHKEQYESGKHKLMLKNYPSTSADTGKMPAYAFSGLNWESPRGWFDDASIAAEADASYNNKIKSKGIMLKGWTSPDSGPNRCEPTLATMLTNVNARANHYVLTRYQDGPDVHMHYTQVGELIPSAVGGGGALKFTGTDNISTPIIGAPAAITNEIKFASAEDSSVSVTCTGPDNDGKIIITLGVYYK